MQVFDWDFKEKLNINEPLTICLGSFETLHLGHNELFKIAKDLKQSYPDQKLAIMMFKNPVKNSQVLTKKAMQPKTRLYTLAMLGFDYVFLVDVNQTILNCSYSDFIQGLKINNVKNVVCGQDFRFGFNREGNIDKLKKYFNVYVANELKVNKQKISSTIINEFIEEGNINGLNKLLIDKYSIIVNSQKFNFKYPEHLNQLKAGIYIANVVWNNIEYHGLIFINKNQFDLNNNLQENNIIYLFDIDYFISKYQELYIEFLQCIRHINNNSENQISTNDIEIAKNYFIANKK